MTWRVIPQSAEAIAQGLQTQEFQASLADDRCRELLQQANDAGFGIFFAINEVVGDSCSKECVRSLRAVFADSDDFSALSREGLAALPPPDLIVQTSSEPKVKAHLYWLVDPRTPLDKFEPAQRRIASLLGTDPHVVDLPRVVRAAGTANTKPDAAGYVSTLAYLAPKRDLKSLDSVFARVPGGLGHTAAQGFQCCDSGGLDEKPASTLAYIVAEARLGELPPAIEGQNGSDALLRACCDARRRGLNHQQIKQAILSSYNPRCVPEWSDWEIDHKIEAALSKVPEIEIDRSGFADVVKSLSRSQACALAAPRVTTPDGDRRWHWDDITAPITEEQYAIPGLRISIGRASLFVGDPGSGKSTAAASMILAIASGQKIWGRFDGGPARSVLHLDWDQGTSQVRRRYQALQRGMKAKPPTGFASIPLCYVRPTFFLNDPPDADGKSGLDKLREVIEQEGSQVVVIDCLTAAVTGVEENRVEFAAPLRHLSALSETLGCVFIVLHHAGKDGTTIRGTSAIEAASGEVFSFSKEDRTVTHTRTQTDPAWEGTICLRKVEDPVPLLEGRIPDLNAIRACRLEVASDEMRASDAGNLISLFGRYEELDMRVLGHLRTAQGKRVTARDLAKVVPKSSAKDIDEALVRLVHAGRVMRTGTAKDPVWVVGAQAPEKLPAIEYTRMVRGP